MDDEIDVYAPWIFGDGEADLGLPNVGDDDLDDENQDVWRCPQGRD